MNNLKSFLLVLTGLYCLPYLSYAQTITQEEFLNQLKQKHPLFEKEGLTAQIQKEERKSYLGAEDWNIFSSASFYHEEPSIAIAGPEKMDALMLNGGVERLFWRTGGRLSASFSSNWSTIEIDPVFRFPESFYENKIALTYVHPLMKNKNGFLNQLQYELKQFDIDFSEVEALENQEDFLANSASKFLNWVLLTEQGKIVSERLKLSEEELGRTKRKREAHLVDQVDVIRAEDAVRIAKQSQMLVEARAKALQAELAELSLNKELYNLGPEFDLYQLQELVPLEEAILQLKQDARIIKILKIRLKQLDYSRRGFEERLKPDLSLVAQLNTKNLDESFGKALAMDKPDALVGIQLSFPLEKRTAKSQVSRTDLQIAKLEKQVEEINLSLVSAVTNLHIQIKEMEKVLELNQEQIESAQEKTKEELKLYNQGRGSLTFVIQSRDSEQNAKLTYAQNSIFYHQLMLQYHSLMDELLPFNLKDQE